MNWANGIESDSVQHTVAIGQAIGRAAEAGDLIALVGELGAGKTQLVRGIAAGMGLDPRQVASPTYVISHEYLPTESDAARLPDASPAHVLVHIDAYRLSGAQELGTIGWDAGDDAEAGELREGAVVVIEWADRVAEALGEDVLWVYMEHTAAGRHIRLDPRGLWQTRQIAMEG